MELDLYNIQGTEARQKKKEYHALTYEFIHERSLLFLKNEKEVLNSFAMKDGFFTDGFAGNYFFLYQLMGNLSSAATHLTLDLDTRYLVFSDSISEKLKSGIKPANIIDIEKKTNKHWNHFKDCWYITESHLLLYLLNRMQKINDQISIQLLKEYSGGRPLRIGF